MKKETIYKIVLFLQIKDRSIELNENLLDFIGKLATKPEAIRTMSAAFGPMIATCAKLEGRLPTDSNLVRGAGFIMGAMQVRLDKENESRRAFIEGLALGATVLFATAGAYVGGPAGSFAAGKAGSAAAGFLGSGIIDYIASKVNTDQYQKDLPNSSSEVLDFFQAVYLFACAGSLSPSTQDKVRREFDLLASGPGRLAAKLSAPTERLRITNFSDLSPTDMKAASAAMVSAALSGKPNDDINPILNFGSNVAAAANMIRTSR